MQGGSRGPRDMATACCLVPTQPAGVGPLAAEEADISAQPAKLLGAGTRRWWGQGDPLQPLGGLREGAKQVTFHTEAEEGRGAPEDLFLGRLLTIVPACACSRVRVLRCARAQAKGCTRTKSWGLGS